MIGRPGAGRPPRERTRARPLAGRTPWASWTITSKRVFGVLAARRASGADMLPGPIADTEDAELSGAVLAMSGRRRRSAPMPARRRPSEHDDTEDGVKIEGPAAVNKRVHGWFLWIARRSPEVKYDSDRRHTGFLETFVSDP